MTTLDEHKKILQEYLNDINEKLHANLLVERQKIMGFTTSEASTNMFAIFLHKMKLISPGFNVNHRFFSSSRQAEEHFPFSFPQKDTLFTYLIKQEELRNKLCYGRDKGEDMVKAAVENLFSLKRIIEKELGEEL
ncbi:MAG: hypothetical protein ABIH34_03445 [Nanoarchaeota archaeon]